MDILTRQLKLGVFLKIHTSVTIRDKEKLNHELYVTDHIFRLLTLLVFLENRSKHFASLLAKIGPAHIVHIYLSFKNDIEKLDNGLG